jgi:hypothetical protein
MSIVRAQMPNRQEILTGLDRRFDEVAAWYARRPNEKFSNAPDGRWTEGQVLDHLILSTKPLNLALRLPKIALRMKFGTAKSPSEPMDAMIARYEAALAGGGKAPRPFVPPAVGLEDKQRLLESLCKEGQRLAEVAGKWSERDLDRYVLPHPLLGNLTVRNMLQFAHYHLEHHLNILKRDY